MSAFMKHYRSPDKFNFLWLGRRSWFCVCLSWVPAVLWWKPIKTAARTWPWLYKDKHLFIFAWGWLVSLMNWGKLVHCVDWIEFVLIIIWELKFEAICSFTKGKWFRKGQLSMLKLIFKTSQMLYITMFSKQKIFYVLCWFMLSPSYFKAW